MLDELAKSLGRDFKDMTILAEATTHGSAGKGHRNYERLEFLGDRVLSLVVADMLLARFPSEPEGDLARRHAAWCAVRHWPKWHVQWIWADTSL